MMSNSILSRENNSIRNDAMPVLWKENTFIILKSIYSRAFIEKCHDSLVDNVKNGQELQMDVVIDMIKKAFSWNDIQWIEEEELLNNIEWLKLTLNQKGLKQQVKLLNHIVSIINGDREEVIEINDDYLSKIFKPYVIGGNDRAINNNNGYLQDRVIKEYMKKQDKDIQKDLLNKLMFELKRDGVLKSDESLTEAKIDMHIRDLLMEYVNSFDDLDYDIVSIIDNLIGLEKNLKKNGTTHDKMVFAFSVMPLLFHRFMDNEVISIYVLYFYYLGIMYSFRGTLEKAATIQQKILFLLHTIENMHAFNSLSINNHLAVHLFDMYKQFGCLMLVDCLYPEHSYQRLVDPVNSHDPFKTIFTRQKLYTLSSIVGYQDDEYLCEFDDLNCITGRHNSNAISTENRILMVVCIEQD